MNLLLLSGGSGKRLWPLSNDIRSKQFIKIFKKEDGTYEVKKSGIVCAACKFPALFDKIPELKRKHPAVPQISF